MSWKYSHPREWILDCRRNIEHDQDNVILYLGEPGQGKSTVMFQHLAAIDPTFSVKRVAFDIPGWIRLSKREPKGVSIGADEVLMSSRKAMHGDNIRLNDRLQVNRGKNHTNGFCFPYETRADSEVLEERTHFKIEIPRWNFAGSRDQARFTILERQVRKATIRRVKRRFVTWVDRGTFLFEQNRGPLWDEYLAAKDAHMDAVDDEDEMPTTAAGGKLDPLSGDDWDGLAAYWRLGRKNPETAGLDSASGA